MMNIFSKQLGKENIPSNAFKNENKSTIGAKLKNLFSVETKQKKIESEIDYYHQYVFPTKVNRIIKKQERLKQK